MKAIKDFEGFYSITREGDVYSHMAGRFRRLSANSSGYKVISLHKDSVKTQHLIHRLVAQTFIPNLEEKPCVNHLDKDRLNNAVKNLEWCTYLENNLHSLEGKLVGSRREHSCRVAHTVIAYTMDGWRAKDIATSLDIPLGGVKQILFEPSYEDVREEYDWSNRPTKSASIQGEVVVRICKLLEQNVPYKGISDLTGVSKKKIGNIKNRVSYKRLSEGFHF